MNWSIGVTMSLLKKSGIWLSMLGILFIQMTSAQAAMVGTPEILSQSERIQLVNMLEREDVQQQLIELGVDPKSSLARVNQMTNEELIQLNGHLSELPVGAGISTVDLLLVIILILLLL